MAQWVIKSQPAVRETRKTRVLIPGQEYALREKWQPTPAFLPWKSHGQRSLVGYRPWGRRVRHDLASLNDWAQVTGSALGTQLKGEPSRCWRQHGAKGRRTLMETFPGRQTPAVSGAASQGPSPVPLRSKAQWESVMREALRPGTRAACGLVCLILSGASLTKQPLVFFLAIFLFSLGDLGPHYFQDPSSSTRGWTQAHCR